MRRIVIVLSVLLVGVAVGAFIVSAAGLGQRYDADRSGYIDSSEVLDAFDDYFGGETTQEEAVEVWMRFAAQVPVATPSPLESAAWPTATPTPLPTATPTPLPTATPTPVPIAQPIEMLNCRKREHGWFYGVSISGSGHSVASGIRKYTDVTFINPPSHPGRIWSYGFGVYAHNSMNIVEVTEDGEWMVKTSRGSNRMPTIHERGYLDEIGVPFHTGEGARNQLTFTWKFYVNGHLVIDPTWPQRESALLLRQLVSTAYQQHYENLCSVYAEDDWRGPAWPSGLED